jgi:hypothetical protein
MVRRDILAANFIQEIRAAGDELGCATIPREQ